MKFGEWSDYCLPLVKSRMKAKDNKKHHLLLDNFLHVGSPVSHG